MLYKIENCHPENYNADNNRLLALSNLLKTNGERKNIVFADRSTLEKIISSETYGRLDKNYAQDILLHEREIGSLSSILEIHTIIDFEIESNEIIYDETERSIILGYNFFTDPEKISPPSFITENESDYKFYKYIALIHQKHTTKQNLGINFNFCLGAGSHCKSQFERLKLEKKMVLCIVDSDKPHPKKAEGGTSAAFKADERGLNGSSFVDVLDHREIESLIPISVIEKIVIEKIRDKIEALDIIKIMNGVDHLSLKHFDLKEGMNIETMIDLDKTHGKFWTDILLKTPKFNTMACIKKREKKSCTNCSSCPQINGICENLLDHALNAINHESSHLIYKNIEPSLMNEWKRLGSLISSWGCHLNSAPGRA